MPFYRICPRCRAYLDFGEHCDCQDKEENAVPVLEHRNGQVDQKLTDPRSTSIVHYNKGGNQA